MFIGYGPAYVLSYMQDALLEKEIKDNTRKFPPNTKVKFTGTVQQLAKCIDSEYPDLDGAKAVMYDGGTGIVMSSYEFSDMSEICYFVEFGDTGCHFHIIPEKYLDFV